MGRAVPSSCSVTVLLLTLVLLGCSENQPSEPDKPTFNYVPLPDAHVTTASAYTDTYEQTVQTAGPDAAAEVLTSLAEDDTLVVSYGTDASTGTFWLRFRDGGTWAWMTIPDEEGQFTGPPMSGQGGPVVAGLSGADVIRFPMDNKALIVDGQWPWYEQSEPAHIRALLRTRGYEVTTVLEDWVTPETFKTLQTQDFVYIKTHGTIVDGATTLATRVPVHQSSLRVWEIPDLYEDDYTENRIVIGYQSSGLLTGVRSFLCVNAAFLEEYSGTFRDNSGVFVNACRSAYLNDLAHVLVDDCEAAAYLGWVIDTPLDLVESWPSDCMLRIVQHLVGHAGVPPAKIKTASVAVTQEIPELQSNYLRLRGFERWGLAPAITDRYFSCASALILEGSFGDAEYSDASVVIGKSTLPYSSWELDEISCPLVLDDLPDTDSLYVKVNGLTSNKASFLPIRGSVQHFYPDNYFLGFNAFGNVTSLEITGPGVTSQWQYPESNDIHIVVMLEGRPVIGDRYTAAASCSDGSSSSMEYSVCDINDNFATPIYPQDEMTVSPGRPTFSFAPAVGAEFHDLLLEDGDGNDIWFKRLYSGATSAVSGVTLEEGQSYRLYLHAFDSNHNQATQTVRFDVE